VAVAVGIGAGGGNDPRAAVDPIVSAVVDKDARVTAQGSVTVAASVPSPFAKADALGVTVGGITVGYSLSEATIAPTVRAMVSDGAQVTANTGSVTIAAERTGANATTHASASGGAVAVSVNAVVSTRSFQVTMLDSPCILRSSGRRSPVSVRSPPHTSTRTC
jgi:hypothetical protein